jgi:hypothetical protein
MCWPVCSVVVGWHILWFLKCSVMAGEVAVAIEKKKNLAVLFCVVEMMMFNSVVAVFGVDRMFCLLRQAPVTLRPNSNEAPVMAQFHFSVVF